MFKQFKYILLFIPLISILIIKNYLSLFSYYFIQFVLLFFYIFIYIRTNSFNFKINLKKIILSIILGFVLGILSISFLCIFYKMKNVDYINYLLNINSDYFKINFIPALIVSPILEEILFRGILYNIFKNNKYVYIIISALLFSLFHFSIIKFLGLFITGTVLSLVYLKEKNILYNIIIHLIINGLSFVLMIM